MGKPRKRTVHQVVDQQTVGLVVHHLHRPPAVPGPEGKHYNGYHREHQGLGHSQLGDGSVLGSSDVVLVGHWLEGMGKLWGMG